MQFLVHPLPRTHELIPHLNFRILIRANGLGLALALLLLSAHVASATTIFVDSDCSLSEAIKSANDDATPTGSSCEAGSGADKIRLTSNLTITRAPTSVTSDITIEGRGKDISGNNNIRPFNVTDGHLKLEYLDIKNTKVRNDNGGAIKVTGSASLTLTRVNIENSHAEIIAIQNTGNGGAIYFDSSGTLTIEDRSNITKSSAQVDGGAVYLKKGTLDIEDTNLNKNKAQGDGGAVYLAGGSTVTFEDVSTRLNVADDSGGAYFIAGGSTVTFDDVSISKNEAKGSGYRGGGGIAIDVGMTGKTVTITDSDISDNKAGTGGGILNGDPYRNPAEGASLVVKRTDFRENRATGASGGAIRSQAEGLTVDASVFKKNRAANGGAIFSGREDLTITKSSFTENSVTGNGGAIWHGHGNKQLTITNSTIGGNAAQYGSGIAHWDGTMTLTHVTVANNKGFGGWQPPAVVASATVGGTSPTVNLVNSIIAGTKGGGADCYNGGSYGTRKGNLIQDGSCLPSVTLNNRKGDPGLGALKDGYYPLKSDSPAINYFSVQGASCPSRDQRGMARPQGIRCDPGAYEYPAISKGQTLYDSRASGYRSSSPTFGFEGNAGERVTILAEAETHSDRKLKLEVFGAYGETFPQTTLKSTEIDLSKRTLALIYNYKLPHTGVYHIRLIGTKKSDGSSLRFDYEVSLGDRDLDARANEGGFKAIRANCALSAATANSGNTALITLGYKPKTLRWNYYVDLKTVKIGSGADPWFMLALTTLDEAKDTDDYEALKTVPSELEKGAKLLKVVKTLAALKHVAEAAKAGLAVKGGVALGIKVAAGAVGGPIVLAVAVGTLALPVYNNIAYNAVHYLTANDFNTGKYADYPIYLPATGVATILPNAFSRGFILDVITENVNDSDGVFVLSTSGAKFAQRNPGQPGDSEAIDVGPGGSTNLNLVHKTIICPGGGFSLTADDDDDDDDDAAPAAQSIKKSTGQQINDDKTDGVDVAAQYGVDSGIAFQRRDAGAVHTIKAANLNAVISAGVKDIIEVWGYAEQWAQTCFDEAVVGAKGGIMFIEKTGLSAQVHTTPQTVMKGSQTCIETKAPGLVVLVAEAPAAPPASTATTLIDCMVKINYAVNCRQAPGGELVTVVPYDVSLTALQRDTGWYQVDNHGQQCWVSGEFVAETGACLSGGPPASASASSAGASTTLVNCMVTTTHIVNFRESPGGPLIDALPYNVTLTAFESAGGWTKVDYHGRQGWISDGYLIESAACS